MTRPRAFMWRFSISRFLWSFGVLVFLAISPTSAFENLSTRIASQPTSPVRILSCEASLLDTDVGNIDYYLAAAVSFENTSPKTASAIEFGFREFDVFGSFLGGTAGQMTGTYSTDVEIDPRKNPITNLPWPIWRWINLYDTASAVKCSVEKVLFDDGTIWSATAPVATSPAPSS